MTSCCDLAKYGRMLDDGCLLLAALAGVRRVRWKVGECSALWLWLWKSVLVSRREILPMYQ